MLEVFCVLGCHAAALFQHVVGVARSWASTCQTIGLNIGYFTSFTAFLALNDAGFCNKYLRRSDARAATGILSLPAYLRFCGWVYLVVTIGIALFKHEVNFPTQKGRRVNAEPHAMSSPCEVHCYKKHRWLFSSTRASILPSDCQPHARAAIPHRHNQHTL